MRVNKVFGTAVVLWVSAMIALVGCDRHGTPDDPISPRADIKITTLNLTSGALLAPISGGTGNVSATSADFPQVLVRLEIFNGIDVQLLDFRVDYFAEDGVTSLGLNPTGGFLTQLARAGTVGDVGVLSIAPGSLPIRNGTTGTPTDILLKVVSDELRSFLAGPNATFRTSSEDVNDTDDFRGLVVAQVRIRGVDINSNRIEVITRLAVTGTVPVVAAGGP